MEPSFFKINNMNYYQMSDAQFIELMRDPKFQTIMIIMAVWSLIWKGIALWKASKNNSKPWFIALLMVNTVGILEMIYIFYFSKKNKSLK